MPSRNAYQLEMAGRPVYATYTFELSVDFQLLEAETTSSGDYAYIARDEQLLVLDVQSGSFPVEVNSLSFQRPVQELKISGNLLYVAAETDLFVFDITDPANPLQIGTHQLHGQSTIGDGFVYWVRQDNIAVLDLSDPANPGLAPL